MKTIKKVVMFCPLCEEEHTLDFVDNPEAEIVVDGQIIKYHSKHYECDKMPEGENSFTTGKWLDEELKEIRAKRKMLNK